MLTRHLRQSFGGNNRDVIRVLSWQLQGGAHCACVETAHAPLYRHFARTRDGTMSHSLASYVLLRALVICEQPMRMGIDRFMVEPPTHRRPELLVDEADFYGSESHGNLRELLVPRRDSEMSRNHIAGLSARRAFYWTLKQLK